MPDPAADRLESWKEIAAYLNRDVRTVQRWEKSEGLPVHRHVHEKQSSVHALKSELDAWRQARTPAASTKPRAPRPVAILIAGAAIAALALWWPRAGSVAPAVLSAVPFTTYPGDERNPTFSPGGDQVAFAWNGRQQDNFDVYVKTIGGADEPLRVTSDPRHEICPAWSPDGRAIAYLRVETGGVASVMVMPALGGEPARAIASTAIRRIDDAYGYITWSRDSKWVILCHRASSQEPCGLRAVSPGTGEVRQLTRADGAWAGDLDPAVSPDGSAIVFARVREIGVEDLFLLRVDANLKPAAPPEQLTNLGIAGSAAWLASGRDLIFSAGEYRATRYLWRTQLPAPARATRIDAIGEDSVNVAIPAAGTPRLIYSREVSDENIWQLDLGAAAAVPRQLISSTRADYNPSYSPDGRRIAFISNRSASSEVWVADAAGSRPVRLTSFAGKLTSNPKWSPDGQSILFDSRADGAPRLYTVSADGGPPRRLSGEIGTEASWSRDGRSIYFQSSRSGRAEIWKMPAAGGPTVQVTRGGGVYALESADGQFLYYAASLFPRPIALWRMPVAGGAPVKILDTLERNLNFTVAAEGIYFAGQDKPDAPPFLGFHDFRTGATRRLAVAAKPLSFGLTVDPSGKSLLFSQLDSKEADLMLVDLR